MLSGGEKIELVLVTGEFLLGILGNGFMVLVNGIDWIKSKKLATGDLILVLLAISRIGLLCALLWSNFHALSHLNELATNQMKIITVFAVLTHRSSTWLGTCLSVFYFLKIANFSHPLFLWLKWRINHVICMLTVGPILFSLTVDYSLITSYYFYAINRENNGTAFQEFQFSESQYIIAHVIMNSLSLIPVTLSLISFSFLIHSLWRHTHQMKLNATGSRDPSKGAHIRAMKATFSFLILFVLFCFGSFMAQFSYIILNKKLTAMFVFPLEFLYPSGHSLILIMYNSKLRQAALKVWWQIGAGRWCSR